ncbi:MAG: tetratricopeptide repeat protein [Gammaproteobacteria bacterium]
MYKALLLSAALLFAYVGREPLALPLTSGMTPTESTASNPALAAFGRGLEALNGNDLDGAERAFKEALEADPKLQVAAMSLADVALRRGRDDDVRKWLDRAHEINPKGVEIDIAWARYHYARREFGKAEALLKAAAKNHPDAFLPRVDLGELSLNQLNKPQQAIDAYRAAARLDPEHAGARFGLGIALARAGKPGEAIEALRESARLDPSNALPLRGIAQVHLAQQRAQEALSAYGEAIKRQPDAAQLFVERGHVHGAAGEQAKALADFDHALRLEQKNVDALLARAMTLQQMNKPQAAQEAYLAVLAINPKHAPSYNNLAWIAVEQNTQLDDALKWATKANELAPDQALFLDTLGWVQRARGDLAGAADTLENAVRQAPEYADSHYHLGVVYSERSQPQRAAEMFDKALTLAPNAPNAADAKRRLEELRPRD